MCCSNVKASGKLGSYFSHKISPQLVPMDFRLWIFRIVNSWYGSIWKLAGNHIDIYRSWWLEPFHFLNTIIVHICFFTEVLYKNHLTSGRTTYIYHITDEITMLVTVYSAISIINSLTWSWHTLLCIFSLMFVATFVCSLMQTKKSKWDQFFCRSR